MNTISAKFLAAAAALALTAGVALAQTTAPAPSTTPAAKTTPAPTTKATGGQKKASTPEGIECSAQADAKGLKGKPRKSFRTKCIADLKKAGGPAKKQ